jgi:hypothetical protein
MLQDTVRDIQQLVAQGLFGEDGDDCSSQYHTRHGGEADVYGHQGSVFAGGSVCDTRPYTDGSVYGDGSMLAGEGLVFAGGSVCDTTQRAGTTAYNKRPPLAASPAAAPPALVPLAASPPPLVPLPLASPQLKPGGPYQARAEDPIDVAVADFFREHPQAYSMNRGFTRICPGRYLSNGREIVVEKAVGRFGDQQLKVRDGPLTQNLGDYLTNQDSTEQYSGSVFQVKNALHSIPQDCRMTFHDTGAGYSRVEAMKVAKEQAATRENVAQQLQKGQSISPGEIQGKYEKMLEKKLGISFQKLAATPEKQAPQLQFSPAAARTSPSVMKAGYSPQGARITCGARSPGCSIATTPNAPRSPVAAPRSPMVAPRSPMAGRSPFAQSPLMRPGSPKAPFR